MSDFITQLKQRVLEAEARAEHAESCLESFWTGDIPDGASLNHLVLAKYGRMRLEEIRKKPALLNPDSV